MYYTRIFFLIIVSLDSSGLHTLRSVYFEMIINKTVFLFNI
jgi:hypothetical protein